MNITEQVKADLDARTKVGLDKYGVGLGQAGLTKREALQHAYEEALDLAQYLCTEIAIIDGLIPDGRAFKGNDGPWVHPMIDAANEGRRLTIQARDHAERRRAQRRTALRNGMG